MGDWKERSVNRPDFQHIKNAKNLAKKWKNQLLKFLMDRRWILSIESPIFFLHDNPCTWKMGRFTHTDKMKNPQVSTIPYYNIA